MTPFSLSYQVTKRADVWLSFALSGESDYQRNKKLRVRIQPRFWNILERYDKRVYQENTTTILCSLAHKRVWGKKFFFCICIMIPVFIVIIIIIIIWTVYTDASRDPYLKTCSLTRISINLLVVYRESVNLIGYITRRLSADSPQSWIANENRLFWTRHACLTPQCTSRAVFETFELPM